MFAHWAMPVKNRPMAAMAVILHRLQRMTVYGPSILHRWFRSLECAAFSKATHV